MKTIAINEGPLYCLHHCKEQIYSQKIAASFTVNQQQICIRKVDFTALTTKSMLSTNTAETLPVIFLFHMFQFLKYKFRGVAQKFPLSSSSGMSLASSGFTGGQEG